MLRRVWTSRGKILALFDSSIRSNMQVPKWTSQRQAADFLGVSERTLMRWRQAGVLQQGEHYRRKFSSPRSPVLYDLPATEAELMAQSRRDHRTLEQA